MAGLWRRFAFNRAETRSKYWTACIQVWSFKKKRGIARHSIPKGYPCWIYCLANITMAGEQAFFFSNVSARSCVAMYQYSCNCLLCSDRFRYWWSSGRGDELLKVPLLSCVRDGAVPLLEGDFNACNYWKASWPSRYWCYWIVRWRTEEQGNQFGPVLQKNLHSLNRLAPVDYITNSWTRERLLDGIRVQLDSLRVDLRF